LSSQLLSKIYIQKFDEHVIANTNGLQTCEILQRANKESTTRSGGRHTRAQATREIEGFESVMPTRLEALDDAAGIPFRTGHESSSHRRLELLKSMRILNKVAQGFVADHAVFKRKLRDSGAVCKPPGVKNHLLGYQCNVAFAETVRQQESDK